MVRSCFTYLLLSFTVFQCGIILILAQTCDPLPDFASTPIIHTTYQTLASIQCAVGAQAHLQYMNIQAQDGNTFSIQLVDGSNGLVIETTPVRCQSSGYYPVPLSTTGSASNSLTVQAKCSSSSACRIAYNLELNCGDPPAGYSRCGYGTPTCTGATNFVGCTGCVNVANTVCCLDGTTPVVDASNQYCHCGLQCPNGGNPCNAFSSPAHGRCDGNTGVCTCFTGWTGSDCGTAAVNPPPPVNLCANINCGVHGTCTGGICNCNAGYSGTTCEFSTNSNTPPANNNQNSNNGPAAVALSNSLSSGEIAGVVVGVLVGTVLIGFCVYFSYRYFQREEQAHKHTVKIQEMQQYQQRMAGQQLAQSRIGATNA
jgi:hypothetical protein